MRLFWYDVIMFSLRIVFGFAKKLRVRYCASWGLNRDLKFLEYEMAKYDPSVKVEAEKIKGGNDCLI